MLALPLLPIVTMTSCLPFTDNIIKEAGRKYYLSSVELSMAGFLQLEIEALQECSLGVGTALESELKLSQAQLSKLGCRKVLLGKVHHFSALLLLS